MRLVCKISPDLFASGQWLVPFDKLSNRLLNHFTKQFLEPPIFILKLHFHPKLFTYWIIHIQLTAIFHFHFSYSSNRIAYIIFHLIYSHSSLKQKTFILCLKKIVNTMFKFYIITRDLTQNYSHFNKNSFIEIHIIFFNF